MNRQLFAALAVTLCVLGLVNRSQAQAQNAVLAEMYGRGVHAYYAGNTTEANQYLTMAIDNGSQDPRAYYFRGMVAHRSGRPEEAEADWQAGAELEASGRTNASIGRSLARFQGSARIRLEEIRQQARLTALANAMARSKQRYGELGAAPGVTEPSQPSAVAPRTATPPAAPPVAGLEDPFADDAMAAGQPNVTKQDALEGAMDDPFAGAAGAAGAPAGAGADPFGGGGAEADPFGGAGAEADPFGGADAGADPFGGAGAEADPFGGGDAGADPFGGAGAGAGGDDPFGGAGDDPFGGAGGDDPFN